MGGKKRSNNRYLHACSVGFCFLVFFFRVEVRSLPKNPAITKRKSFVCNIYIKFIKSSLKKDESFVFQLSFPFTFKMKQDFVELVSTGTCLHFVLILNLVQYGGSLFELFD